MGYNMEAYSLSNKIALVTGASRKIGIGAAIARELAQGGADSFIAYYHDYDAGMAWGSQPRESQATLIELRGLGVRAEGLNLDLTEADAPVRLFERVEETLGLVDILVNNAGMIHRDAAESFPADAWNAVLQVNLTSVFRLSQLAGVEMLKRRRGKIINIASLLSFQGGIRIPAYAAAKGGIAQFTKALANEWAAHGINVMGGNVTHPAVRASAFGNLPRIAFERVAVLAHEISVTFVING